MSSNNRSCSNWRLYVIVDRAAAGTRPLAEIADAAIRGGADVLQLRDKTASAATLLAEATTLLRLTRAAGIPLIVNDHADIARAAGADGVHLGQDDLSVADARRLLGPERLIGQSTHSLEQARAAEAEGSDYIGVGPIFPTPTKPDYPHVGLGLIRQVMRQVNIPAVCIGGIDADNLAQVLKAGAERIAVVRAVCAASDPQAATRRLKDVLNRFHKSARTALRAPEPRGRGATTTAYSQQYTEEKQRWPRARPPQPIG